MNAHGSSWATPLGHRFDADLARLETSLQREMRQLLLAMFGALSTMTAIILAFS